MQTTISFILHVRRITTKTDKNDKLKQEILGIKWTFSRTTYIHYIPSSSIYLQQSLPCSEGKRLLLTLTKYIFLFWLCHLQDIILLYKFGWLVGLCIPWSFHTKIPLYHHLTPETVVAENPQKLLLWRD